MSYETKLEVYTVQIRQQRDTKNFIKLDSIFGETDFYQFFQDYIKSFDKMSIMDQHQKSIQFKKETLHLKPENRYVSGIIDSGEYGIDSKIVNIETGEEKYHKTIKDTDIKPFYFMFYIPKKSDKAFILIQRIGIFGINGIFRSHMEGFLKTRYPDLVIEFSPFVSKELAKTLINDGDIQEMELKRYNLPSDITDKVGVIKHKEDILYFSFKIVARKRHRLEFNERVRKFVDNPNAAMFNVSELKSLGFTDGDHTSSIKVKHGKHLRTIDLSDTGQIRPYYDIEREVEKDIYGHPVFDSINSLAVSLIQDIKNETGIIDNV